MAVSKDIRQRNESLIDEAELVLASIKELEHYAEQKGKPHLHYRFFHNDLKVLIDRFKRMQR